MKRQVIIIHGGEYFGSYKKYLKFLKNYKIDLEKLKKWEEGNWKNRLQKKLGNNFMVIFPKMPSMYNAKYKEWKMWFDKLLPYLKNRVILIGHSLGGIFLAKYLSENNFPVKISSVHLVAAPYDDKNSPYSLGDFILPKSLKKFEKQSENIFLYHSKDDPIVPFTDLKKYAKTLPNAEEIIFKNRNHFSQKTFPELIKRIKN